jgi:hypothetical protein
VSIGDELVSIDGKSVAGMALCDVQDLISGDAGTSSTFKLCSMKSGSTWSVKLSMEVPAWAVAPGYAPSAVGAASSAAPSLSWGSALFPATPPGSPPTHKIAASSRPSGRRGSQGERGLLEPPSAFENGNKDFTRTTSDEARYKARIQSDGKGGLSGDQIAKLMLDSSDNSWGGASPQGGLAASTFTLSPEDGDTSPIMAVGSQIRRRKSDGKIAQNYKNKEVWARASSAGEASPSATTLVVNLGSSLSSSPRTPTRASKQAAAVMRSRSSEKSSPGRNSPVGGASGGQLRKPFVNSPFVESAVDKNESKGEESGAKLKESPAAPAAVSPRISSPPLKISRPPPPLSAVSHLSKSMPSVRIQARFTLNLRSSLRFCTFEQDETKQTRNNEER